MNDMQIFKNEEFGQIRMIEVEGKPYFIANDVARALGYSVPKDAISRHCKGALKHRYLTDGGLLRMQDIRNKELFGIFIRMGSIKCRHLANQKFITKKGE